MKGKKLIKRIENHYLRHGVFISLKLISNNIENERFVLQFKIQPGTKIDMIFSCAPDIKTAMRFSLFYPFRDGKNVCLAVSKKYPVQNSLYEMLTSKTFCRSQDALPLALGYNMMGEMVFSDLEKMPHVMYAGATNSGKSVGLICLILSLIVRQPVETTNLLILDTGTNEMEIFNDIPHLSYPVVNDVQTGIYVILELVKEMERRGKLERIELQTQPAIICVIDEFISFVDHASNKKLSQAISDLLRRGRHAKIHMVLAAQDPTKENMKVDISNITSRIAFRCAKCQNSTTVLGVSGAEKLAGKGAALYKTGEHSDPILLQGAYMSPEEVERLVTCVKQVGLKMENKYLIAEREAAALSDQETGILECIPKEDNGNKELADIIMWILQQSSVSANQVKQKFSMGNRANDIMEKICKMGIISDKCAKQPRKVLLQSVNDVSKEVMEVLADNGFSEEDVAVAIRQRS